MKLKSTLFQVANGKISKKTLPNFIIQIAVICTLGTSLSAYSFEWRDILSKSYTPKWQLVENNFYIDLSSIKKSNLGLATAVFKTESRDRAREVGAAQYEYTAFVVDFDCKKNEIKVIAVYDNLKDLGLQSVSAGGVGEWTPIANQKSEKFKKGFNVACK